MRTDLPGGTETVLVVEDNHAVRRLVCHSLRRFGYSIHDAPDGESAIAVAANIDGPIHLLLTDLVLPGMDGRQLAYELRKSRADLRVLMTTGQSDDVLAQMEEAEDDFHFLGKPFERDELARAIRKALGMERE